MNPTDSHEGGLGVADQIRRYRSAFLAVVAMFAIGVLVAAYVLGHENLKLPSWVPVLGKSYFTLKADFQTAQAITPGQGQAVTIAGAKIGEIASVDLNNGVGVVTMRLTPKYAHDRIYHNATLLLRPKTQLQDMTIEIDPGTPSSGVLASGATIPQSQTAPDVNFDEVLASLDAETRAYLQELLAGAGEGLKGNGRALSAAFKRFDPTARDLQEISSQLETRHTEIEDSIHNFRLLMEALGGKDKQLAEVIASSNTVFKIFAQEEKSVQSALRLFPGALEKTQQGLGKITTAARLVGPTLKQLQPFARATAPAEEASRPLFAKTTPVFKKQIRPFAREILPVIDELQPDTRDLSAALPKFASSLKVINELFNEFAYNPGSGKGGFLFYLDWANHDFNSAVSTADANGPLGNVLAYFNCNVVPILKGAAEVNPTVRLLLGLLNPPTGAACATGASGTTTATATAASANGAKGRGGSARTKGLLSGLSGDAFGQAHGSHGRRSRARTATASPSRAATSSHTAHAGATGRGG